jgi:energy-coupling factor transporter ATP-binding protein EcfA2
MRRETRAIVARVDRDIDPDTPVSALSVAEQQLVEIARALSLDSRLIIMDEPTSALTEAEVRQLMGIMEALRRDGVAIMFVTHRLEEASAMCDRMTVLRDGRLAGHLVREGGPIPVPRIIERMVGRAATELYARPARREGLGAVRLSVRGLRTVRAADAPHAIVLDGVDLDLRAARSWGSQAWWARGAPSSPARSSGPTGSLAARWRSTAWRSPRLARRGPRPRARAGPRGPQAAGDLPDAGHPAELRRSLARCVLEPPRLHGWRPRRPRPWPSTAELCRSAWPRPTRPSTGCRAAISRRSSWRAGWRATPRC